MFKFVHYGGESDKRLTGYNAYLYGLVKKSKVALRFDTGADFTVINSRALHYNRKQVEKILDLVNTKTGIIKKAFISASGHTIYGYLCHGSNVLINDAYVKKFYYYLILDDNATPTALLGDDFITYCTFSHGCEGYYRIRF